MHKLLSDKITFMIYLVTILDKISNKQKHGMRDLINYNATKCKR